MTTSEDIYKIRLKIFIFYLINGEEIDGNWKSLLSFREIGFFIGEEEVFEAVVECLSELRGRV